MPSHSEVIEGLIRERDELARQKTELLRDLKKAGDLIRSQRARIELLEASAARESE